MKMDLDTAAEKYIERDDIVIRVAKMIDPGAFAVWFDCSSDDAKPVPPDTRKKYMRSRAICLANDILKLASATRDLPKVLAESEAAWWKLMGVPVDDPKLRKVIDDKYAEFAKRPLSGELGTTPIAQGTD